MGLDVYLSHFAKGVELARNAENAAQQEVEAAWERIGGYDAYKALPDLAQKEFDAERAAIYAKHGCTGEYERHETHKEVGEINSAKYPDHMFKIGYFRSSYNGGGINSQLQRMGLPSLYGIFDVEDDHDYYVSPDWQESRRRAASTLDKYLSIRQAPGGRLDAKEIHRAIHPEADDEKGAIDIARREFARPSPFSSGWSNGVGEFYPEGFNVKAIVYGKPGFLGTGIFLVYERPEQEEDWIGRALEIVVETCDWVLAKSDPQNYALRWSS